MGRNCRAGSAGSTRSSRSARLRRRPAVAALSATSAAIAHCIRSSVGVFTMRTMSFNTFGLAVVGLLLGTSVCAQDLAGDWQGTLQAGNPLLRLIVKLRHADDGGWTGTLYSIDQGTDRGLGQPLVSITQLGAQVKFAVEGGRGAFEGRLGGDASSIEGTWMQRQSQPLVLRRATPDTAWKDPAAHTIQFLTVDKNVRLEVLDFGGSGSPIV